MNRDISPEMLVAIDSGLIIPVFLVMLELRSKTEWIWSGIGDLVWDGQTYAGVGALGNIAPIRESTDERADGTSIGLSGINSDLLGESLSDISVGKKAKIWFGAFSPLGGLVGAPVLVYSGTVDVPTIRPGAERFGIDLKLETRLINQQRATNRRYTTADQHIAHPDDTAFNWVEFLNDVALKWGY